MPGFTHLTAPARGGWVYSDALPYLERVIVSIARVCADSGHHAAKLVPQDEWG
jgi:hypothetical protein